MLLIGALVLPHYQVYLLIKKKNARRVWETLNLDIIAESCAQDKKPKLNVSDKNSPYALLDKYFPERESYFYQNKVSRKSLIDIHICIHHTRKDQNKTPL